MAEEIRWRLCLFTLHRCAERCVSAMGRYIDEYLWELEAIFLKAAFRLVSASAFGVNRLNTIIFHDIKTPCVSTPESYVLSESDQVY